MDERDQIEAPPREIGNLTAKALEMEIEKLRKRLESLERGGLGVLIRPIKGFNLEKLIPALNLSYRPMGEGWSLLSLDPDHKVSNPLSFETGFVEYVVGRMLDPEVRRKILAEAVVFDGDSDQT